jgi:hypothetical protein
MEKITSTAQEAANKIPQLTQTYADNLAKALQNLTDNLNPIIDRLAGTESTITLSFKELTLDTGKSKATLTGAINLQASSKTPQHMHSRSGMSGDAMQVDGTVGQVE